jgi:hypothetical protein
MEFAGVLRVLQHSAMPLKCPSYGGGIIVEIRTATLVQGRPSTKIRKKAQ